MGACPGCADGATLIKGVIVALLAATLLVWIGLVNYGIGTSGERRAARPHVGTVIKPDRSMVSGVPLAPTQLVRRL
jgi:hypothetical protein